MSDNKDRVLKLLEELGLSGDEALIYTELLKGAKTHLRLAEATGLNRTKVYRLAERLEKRSLVSARFDDAGTTLAASDPATFEVELVTKEEALKRQRTIFNHLLPTLNKLQLGTKEDFAVHTYGGVQGFKQMLWHELKAKDELLTIGKGTIEQLTGSVRWSEKHRAMSTEAGITVRQLLNVSDPTEAFTRNKQFMDKHFESRLLDEDVLLMRQTMSIYNNTVAIYHWREEEKIGLEIVSKMYTAMMRQMFEYYWRLAKIHKTGVLG
jgi:sugar-specific transcriptional regulator TrmB